MWGRANDRENETLLLTLQFDSLTRGRREVDEKAFQ